MATTADEATSPGKPKPSSPQGVDAIGNYLNGIPKILRGETPLPWIDYAMEQAKMAQRTIQYTVDSALDSTRSRLQQIRTTSSAHFNQALDTLQEAKSDSNVYEEIAMGKIKEGIYLAVSNPLITTGAVLGVGLLGLKRPRRFIYYRIRRFFVSEEALLSRADAKVKELRHSFELLKAEAEKLEKSALQAEEEMTRGRTKLRQAGKQIQGAIRSAYKIERQAGGLKDVLRELPSIEASRFRTQVYTSSVSLSLVELFQGLLFASYSSVTNLAKEAKKERSFLTKEVAKISNYGISA